MTHRIHVIILQLTLIILTTACVPYPVYKTLQPSAVVQVVDDGGHPITDAEVHLVTHSFFQHDHPKNRSSKKTASNGVAEFDSQHEWRTEFMALHGAEHLYWSLCVQSNGFKTYRNSEIKTNKMDVKIKLSIGESTPCIKNQK